MSDNNFGVFFKDLRKRYGYKTQKQLADVSGISQTTLSRIEAGTQRPQPETLRILAQHLRPYTYGELMEHAGYFEGLPNEDRDFVMGLFNESEIYEIDKSIENIIRQISTNNYFKTNVIPFLKTELEPIFEAEGWGDVEFTPDQIRQLIAELGYNSECKISILSSLERVVKLSHNHSKNQKEDDIQTIAAHHDGEDWTEEELETIRQFKEFVKSQRKK